MTLHLYIDGACKGNPGPGGIGIAVYDEKNNLLKQYCQFIPHCTNNIAEYTALVKALEAASRLGASRLHVYSDSLLLVRQYRKEYKVKEERLKSFLEKIRQKASRFAFVSIEHIPREKNKLADSLANLAVKRQKAKRPLLKADVAE